MQVEITNKRTRDVFIRADVRFTDVDYDETRTFDGYNWEQIKESIEKHLEFLAKTQAEILRVPEGKIDVTIVDEKAVLSDSASIEEVTEPEPVIEEVEVFPEVIEEAVVEEVAVEEEGKELMVL
jgi:hypothetical protein